MSEIQFWGQLGSLLPALIAQKLDVRNSVLGTPGTFIAQKTRCERFNFGGQLGPLLPALIAGSTTSHVPGPCSPGRVS